MSTLTTSDTNSALEPEEEKMLQEILIDDYQENKQEQLKREIKSP